MIPKTQVTIIPSTHQPTQKSSSTWPISTHQRTSPKPSSSTSTTYPSLTQDLVYEGFFEDFGPLNLAKIWKYIAEVQKFLTDKKYAENVFYHFTSPHFAKCTNSALLVCAYLVTTIRFRSSSRNGLLNKPSSPSATSTSDPSEMLDTDSVRTSVR